MKIKKGFKPKKQQCAANDGAVNKKIQKMFLLPKRGSSNSVELNSFFVHLLALVFMCKSNAMFLSGPISMLMLSFNNDEDRLSYGYMTFSCGHSDDSGTVNVNVSMQLIMI